MLAAIQNLWPIISGSGIVFIYLHLTHDFKWLLFLLCNVGSFHLFMHIFHIRAFLRKSDFWLKKLFLKASSELTRPLFKCAMWSPLFFLTKNFWHENQHACLESAIYEKLSGNYCIAEFSAKAIQRHCMFFPCLCFEARLFERFSLLDAFLVTLDAVLSFNDSSIACANILTSLGLKPGRNEVNWLKEVDHNRRYIVERAAPQLARGKASKMTGWKAKKWLTMITKVVAT